MGHAQLSTRTEGLLIRLSKFLKSCAPYNIITPGYSILYATINAYKALMYTHVPSRLKNFISNSTIKSYKGTRELLRNLLDVGSDRADKWFTTLYEGYEEQEERLSSNDMKIERSTRSACLAQGVCVVISGMVAAVTAILTIAASAILICLSAALLPLIPLAFLACTTAAIEQYAALRVRSVFRTDVRDDISEYIGRCLSSSHSEKVEKLRNKFGASFSIGSVTEDKIYNKPPKPALVAGEALSMSGEVLSLALLTPFFLLVAPLSLAVAGTVFMLSVCSFDKKAIDRNIKIMSSCTTDFLPIVAAARTGAIPKAEECPPSELEEVVVQAQKGYLQQHQRI